MHKLRYLIIINKVHKRRLGTFSFGTGLSYKLPKNHPHLTEFKDFIYSFQLEFAFELIYMLLGLIGQPGRSLYFVN